MTVHQQLIQPCNFCSTLISPPQSNLSLRSRTNHLHLSGVRSQHLPGTTRILTRQSPIRIRLYGVHVRLAVC